MGMKTSQLGINLIKSFESFRSHPYLDAVGRWTIGFGSTRGITENTKPITEAQGTQMLMNDLAKFENIINTHVKQPLKQWHFDSLADFCYNCGPGNFEGSTLLAKINEAKYSEAAEEFLRWNKAGGKVLAGLTRRREAERNLFLGITE